MPIAPSLRVERALQRDGHRVLAGMDEVGRGAHAGQAEGGDDADLVDLRLAGVRALGAIGIRPDLVILDGNHDWLTAPEDVGLFAFADEAPVVTPPVTTMIKADLKCSSVAAASVLAKVTRDAIMVGLGREIPAYGWVENKGYAAPEHLAALEAHGATDLHRRSWRLPGISGDDGTGLGDRAGQGALTAPDVTQVEMSAR